ncbi:MAG: hypothetical protein AB8G77_09800 [Rhodothermales bacterium]
MLNPDYRDILQAFSDEQVEYLLVGAYALAAHGYPRATGDIDLWVNPTGRNASKVMRALALFGAPLSQISESDFKTLDIVFQIGVEPNRIDILTQLSGVNDFKEVWLDRLEISIEGLAIPVIGKASLIQNKRSTGRPKDLADLAWLEQSE